MKLFPLLIGLVITLLTVSPCRAQEAAGHELETLKQHYEEEVSRVAGQPHTASISELNKKYLSALDRAQATAQQAGQLEQAVAIAKEKEAVVLGKQMPARDDDTVPPVVKQLRDFYREALGRLEVERDHRIKPARDIYVKALSALIVTLTKEGRLDEAIKVKKLRDEMPAEEAPMPVNAAKSLIGASRDHPFVNSLGMRFVPVPGMPILMCAHETRRQDYAAFAGSGLEVNGAWKNQKIDAIPSGAENNHPVVGVNWADAKSFCDWLSKQEGRTYRLPTDHEWSAAAGIAAKERKDLSPAKLSEKIKGEYPWGASWPPPPQSGNFADASYKQKFSNQPVIEGYADGFPTTSPVMTFKPNKLGIYDLAGNVWEWCEDWYGTNKIDRVSRGGSFRSSDAVHLGSSARDHTPADRRVAELGFRCVLVISP